MSRVNYYKCDGCQRQLSAEETRTSIRLAIWNPDKRADSLISNLFEPMYGRTTPKQGEHEVFEFCSAACVLLAVKAQALLEV